MIEFVQLAVNGLMLGSLYAILALGFVLIAKGSGVINFSQGELVLIGGYFVAWFLADLGWPVWFGVPAAVLCMVLLGMLIERVALRPLENESVLALVMATIAIGIIIRSVVPIVWGEGTRALPSTVATERIQVGEIFINPVGLMSAIFVVLFLAIFGWFFSHSRLGLAMQAVADDRLASQSLGVSVRRINAASWAISGGVAAFAGFAWGSLAGVDQRLVVVGLLVFPVVILGGLESIAGALVGGLIVGVVESMSAGYLGPIVGGGFSVIVPMLLLIAVLMVRPYGLFGRPDIKRV